MTRRAFTLIEVLVVVAIIALLVVAMIDDRYCGCSRPAAPPAATASP